MEYFVSNNLDINKFYESAYPFFSIYLGVVGEQSSSLSRQQSASNLFIAELWVFNCN